MSLVERRLSQLDPSALDTSEPIAGNPGQAKRSGVRDAADIAIPDYLRDVYTWAYLSRLGVSALDNPVVFHGILWGNGARLTRVAVAELEPGQKVLQPACVYGGFSASLARTLGPQGRLVVTDVAPIQIANAERKLRPYPQASVGLADARYPVGGPYDAVCCFFLLHEVPDSYKKPIVDGLLSAVRPGGKVIFVDYHRPHWANPLKPLMSVVFDTLEPFAKGLWDCEIAGYAQAPERFEWRKETYFGGLYQKVVARCLAPAAGPR